MTHAPRRFGRRALRKGVLATIAAVWAATLLLPATHVAAGKLRAPLVPRKGALFGAWSAPAKSWSQTMQKKAILRLERHLGRKLAIDHKFYKWGEWFPTWRERWDLDKGRIPMISWRGTYVSKINSGSQDWLIRKRADAIKALKQRVFIRWAWEMDGAPNGWISDSPWGYINAWRRIHTIFKNRGATNAVWVWCPTAWGFESGKAQRYYPGDAYVDWICADGYNWAPGRPGSKWRGFKEIYAAFYRFGEAHGKPLMAGEYGAQERRAREKARWLRYVGVTLREHYRRIKAVVYFDSYTKYDWRYDTSHSAAAAFRDLGQLRYFRPRSR